MQSVKIKINKNKQQKIYKWKLQNMIFFPKKNNTGTPCLKYKMCTFKYADDHEEPALYRTCPILEVSSHFLIFQALLN